MLRSRSILPAVVLPPGYSATKARTSFDESGGAGVEQPQQQVRRLASVADTAA